MMSVTSPTSLVERERSASSSADAASTGGGGVFSRARALTTPPAASPLQKRTMRLFGSTDEGSFIESDEHGHSSLTSPEDQWMMETFKTLEEETTTLLERIESRKKGYNAFKQAKKQASAVKNQMKFVFRDIASLVLKGERAEKISKKDEFKDIIDSLTSRHDVLMESYRKSKKNVFELQVSLLEGAKQYESRMQVCLEYNTAISLEVQVSSRKVFDYLQQLDECIKSLTSMSLYINSVNELSQKSTKSSGYIPWSMREAHAAANKEKNEKAEKERISSAETAAELERRLELLCSARVDSEECLKTLMRKKMEIETVVGVIRGSLRSLKIEKLKIQESNGGILPTAGDDDFEADACDRAPVRNTSSPIKQSALVFDVNALSGDKSSQKFDHALCQDCTQFPPIGQMTAEQLKAASAKSDEQTKRIDQLTILRERIALAQKDISEFDASGDLPSSYSGGLKSP